MADPIARPTFYEGEILPAADLIAAVDYARNQTARHDRYLHRWGIVDGLALQGKQTATASGQKYTAVTLTAGIAIDGYGRELVLPADQAVDASGLASVVSPQSGVWYPVFLQGRDQAATPSASPANVCAATSPTQVQEIAEIGFGPAGSQLNPDQQGSPALTDPPDDGVSVGPWRILLGYVQWDPVTREFADVGDEPAGTGVARRYIGVTAATVVSPGGSVRLSTHPVGFTGATDGPILALELHETNNGELVFGKQNTDGSLAQLLTVSASGDVTAAGKLMGAVTPGSAQVQSGQAFDGVVLPLPVGVDPTKALLHFQITPRLDLAAPPPGVGPMFPIPLECRVDPATREAHCRVQWWDMSVTPPVSGLVLPAPFEYLVIAAVAGS
jgi:hypothetical protein